MKEVWMIKEEELNIHNYRLHSIYFVPALGRIFGHTNEYDQDTLISMSRTWVILNIARFIILVTLFITGLRALARFNSPVFAER